VKKFSSHSVQSAAVSKASAKFVSVDKVLKVAGWSNAKTFAKFLNQGNSRLVFEFYIKSHHFRDLTRFQRAQSESINTKILPPNDKI
jgi:hypothetical protein